MLRQLLIWSLRLRIQFRTSLIKELRRSHKCTCDVALLRARNGDDLMRLADLRRQQRGAA